MANHTNKRNETILTEHFLPHTLVTMLRRHTSSQIAKRYDPISLAIIIALVAVVALGALLVVPDIAQQARLAIISMRNRTHTYAFEGLTVRGPFSRPDAQLLNDFLTEALKPELLPKTLSFQLAQKPANAQGPDAYVANWNKDGKPISMLYGKTPDGKNPSYARIWIMPPGERVTKDQADKLFASLFSQTYLSAVGPVVCEEIKNPEGKPMTECAAIKTMEDESLRGLTVRAPFLLVPPSDFPPGAIPPEEVIIVSACLVPPNGALYYKASSCL